MIARLFRRAWNRLRRMSAPPEAEAIREMQRALAAYVEARFRAMDVAGDEPVLWN